MQISNVYIRNFRAINELSIDLYSLSSLIGANNCGKSTIFKAIDLFFEAGGKIGIDDFHRNNTAEPIEVSIIFSNLTEDERREFGSAVLDGKLQVTREFTLSESTAPNYAVSARAFPPFSDIRSAPSPSEKLSLYRGIQAEYGLPTVRSGEDVVRAIAQWEQDHEDRLELMSLRGFFGATNVANGKIKKKTSIRLIPAVRDSAEEARTGRKSPVLELLSDIARQTLENRDELKQFMAEAERRFSELTDPATIPELAEIGRDISEIVRYYYSDSSVIADWERSEPLSVNFPKPKIVVQNNDITTNIEYVGHGLQRVILFSLIQYMAERSVSSVGEDIEFHSPQSDIILLVEEPEIYQHPIKQTILYKNFGRIVQSYNKSNGIRFQIVFATHSEKFVSMRDFEICRIIRKKIGEGSFTQNSVGSVRLRECIDDFAAFNEPPSDPMHEDAFASKLHVFSRDICEGFFAEKLILVEGAADKAIIEAYYESLDRDNNLQGIQIIAAGGKGMMQKPAYIFRKVGIPTFIVFDNDDKEQSRNRAQKVMENRFLQKILGSHEIFDMPEGLGIGFYAFSGDMEEYVKRVIGAESFDKQFAALSAEWGLPVKDIKKTPAAFTALFRIAYTSGYRFDSLEQIVLAVDQM